MKKKSEIEQKIEETIMKLPDDDRRKIEYLERKSRTMHICFTLPDGTLAGAWIHEGESEDEVINRITDNWYKYKKTQEPQKLGKCPLCGGDLILRENKGRKFVGCNNFPYCKYIKPYENK